MNCPVASNGKSRIQNTGVRKTYNDLKKHVADLCFILISDFWLLNTSNAVSRQIENSYDAASCGELSQKIIKILFVLLVSLRLFFLLCRLTRFLFNVLFSVS